MASAVVSFQSDVTVSAETVVDAFRQNDKKHWPRALAWFIRAMDDYACDNEMSRNVWGYLETVRKRALRDDDEDWLGKRPARRIAERLRHELARARLEIEQLGIAARDNARDEADGLRSSVSARDREIAALQARVDVYSGNTGSMLDKLRTAIRGLEQLEELGGEAARIAAETLAGVGLQTTARITPNTENQGTEGDR